MTAEEKQEIIIAILEALNTNALSIDQLTETNSINDESKIELNSRLSIRLSVLKELFKDFVSEIGNSTNKAASQSLVTSLITEYNVSYHHSNSDGTNVFTLEQAINKVPAMLRNIVRKLSFIADGTKQYVTYSLIGTANDWSRLSLWTRSGTSYIMANSNLDVLNSADKCGEYKIVSGKNYCGRLSVIGDNMGHTVNQILVGNWVLEQDGSFNWEHVDGTTNVLYRSYNVNSPNDFIPKGTWSEWNRIETNQSVLKYFGGILDSCTVEVSAYTGDIAPADVFYTERAGLPGLPIQSVQSFVGKVGDKYYRQFKNISSYSQTGINLDAGKIYIDVNNKLIYVANTDYLYGVIRIGSERAVADEMILTQAEYDALGSYDDNTRYYIIEG